MQLTIEDLLFARRKLVAKALNYASKQKIEETVKSQQISQQCDNTSANCYNFGLSQK